jgi:hypothetical protein
MKIFVTESFYLGEEGTLNDREMGFTPVEGLQKNLIPRLDPSQNCKFFFFFSQLAYIHISILLLF